MRPFAGTWRHANTLDIELDIIRVMYRHPCYTVVKAVLYRRDHGSGKLFLWPKATYRIMREQEKHWKMLGVNGQWL